MSLSGKNRALFSYKHDDRSGSIFQYKNFEKTKSYNSKFMHAKFIGTSLRSAHMKYCNFDNCLFDQVDFVGSNMRGSSFIGARFIKCTFVSAVFEKANFKNATFENCYWVATSHANIRNFPEDSEDIMILTSFPSQDTVNPELLQVIESLRKNDIIRRSHTLHGKKGKINTISLLILNQEYTDDELIQLLPKLSQLVTSASHRGKLGCSHYGLQAHAVSEVEAIRYNKLRKKK